MKHSRWPAGIIPFHADPQGSAYADVAFKFKRRMLLQVALIEHVAASSERAGSSSNARLMLLQRMLLMLVTQQNDDVSQEGQSACRLLQ